MFLFFEKSSASTAAPIQFCAIVRKFPRASRRADSPLSPDGPPSNPRHVSPRHVNDVRRISARLVTNTGPPQPPDDVCSARPTASFSHSVADRRDTKRTSPVRLCANLKSRVVEIGGWGGVTEVAFLFFVHPSVTPKFGFSNRNYFRFHTYLYLAPHHIRFMAQLLYKIRAPLNNIIFL